MIKVLDLFSGVGGFSLALDAVEHEGEKVFETVAFCEWDEDCRKILNKHWPDTPIFHDVNNLKYVGGELTYTSEDGRVIKKVSHIDMICGGFP